MDERRKPDKKAGHTSSKLSTIFFGIILSIFATMVCLGMSYLFALQRESVEEINQLKNELNELKAVVAVANNHLNDQKNDAPIRSKRQTSRVKDSNTGDNLPVF